MKADLKQTIIHLHPKDAAIRVNDANLPMLNGAPSAISKITTGSGLQIIWINKKGHAKMKCKCHAKQCPMQLR